MKVYLAGPDVFLPDGAAVGDRKKDICARYGLVGLFPLDNELTTEAGSTISQRIFRENTRLMDQADALLANLTPFRGPSADVGTVFELGYMAASRKLCLGYSNMTGTYVEKVGRLKGVRRDPVSGRYVDDDGLFVEDFGLSDNLMIIEALSASGYPLFTPDRTPHDLWHDLTVFEACVRQLSLLGADAARERQTAG